MSYCVNCGQSYEAQAPLCVRCHGDPCVPEHVIDADLKGRKGQGGEGDLLVFGYPGEAAALTIALVIFSAGLVALGVVSFGVFVVIIGMRMLWLLFLSDATAKAHMIEATEQTMPLVRRLANIAAFRLRMPLPAVYVTQNPAYNAYATGFGRLGRIVVHSSLLQDFPPHELLFVLGHELGHMKRHHTKWLMMLDPARAGGARFLPTEAVSMIFNVWSVKAEYTADQAGLIACRDPETASRALLRLAVGSAAEGIDVKSLLRARAESDTVVGQMIEFQGTHPLLMNRVRHIQSFAASAPYRAIAAASALPRE